MNKHPSSALTVDLAIFTIRESQLVLLLIKRGADPYADHWALPGGFVGPQEDAESAAWRELAEETGVERFSGHLEQLRTYSAPDRDPRQRVISVAHVAMAPALPDPEPGTDAAAARWWPVAEMGELNLAFDHAHIVGDALERVRSKLEYTTLAAEFVPQRFTLADLHRVYAAVWNTPPPLGNFRRKVLSTDGFVEATDEKAPADAAGGPRPTLYRRGVAQHLQPAMLRPSTAAEEHDE